MTRLDSVVLGMDARMLTGDGLGISTYAAALAKAQSTMSSRHCLVTDGHCLPGPARSSLSEKIWRDLRARFLSSLTLRQGGANLGAPDIYRLGQVRFRRRGTLLRLVPPFSGGIVHWALPLPVRIEGWVNIYTIHDVIPLTHPCLTPMDEVRHRCLLDAVIDTADHIVTVSDHARDAIVHNTGCNPESITNCSIPVRPTLPGGRVVQCGLTPGGYYIYAGSSEPRKNIARIVDAHAASGSTRPLVLVGDHDAAAKGRCGVMCLPRQSSADLATLIANARALLHPSLAEGFGLPVVEAMALGTAVLTSEGGALEEVAGGAALLVAPRETASILNGLSEMDRNDDLIARLEDAGRARARFFSPELFANRLEQLYSALLTDHGIIDAAPRFS